MSTYQYYCNECECTTLLDEEDEQQWARICEHCQSEEIEFESIID